MGRSGDVQPLDGMEPLMWSFSALDFDEVVFLGTICKVKLGSDISAGCILLDLEKFDRCLRGLMIDDDILHTRAHPPRRSVPGAWLRRARELSRRVLREGSGCPWAYGPSGQRLVFHLPRTDVVRNSALCRIQFK